MANEVKSEDSYVSADNLEHEQPPNKKQKHDHIPNWVQKICKHDYTSDSYKTKFHTNITLVSSDGVEFFFHANLLIAVEYFDKLINGSWEDSSKKVILLECHSSVTWLLLSFLEDKHEFECKMESGYWFGFNPSYVPPKIDISIIMNLHTFANFLRIDKLMEICVRYLKSKENIIINQKLIDFYMENKLEMKVLARHLANEGIMDGKVSDTFVPLCFEIFVKIDMIKTMNNIVPLFVPTDEQLDSFQIIKANPAPRMFTPESSPDFVPTKLTKNAIKSFAVKNKDNINNPGIAKFIHWALMKRL